ncbi:MAG: WYL domain-containing transcriptional regulator, partial [Rhodoferax sp.]
TVSRSDFRHDGRWDKASEIAAKLNDAGYDVSVRTVQRDLKELSEIFPIELNDKNARDYGWRWIKGANLDIPGMSVSEALAMRLVETHLKQLLPSSMLESLNGVFSLAQAKLDKLEKQNNNHAKDWLDKVRVVPPAQPLLPPVVNEAVQSAIYQGLLEDKQLMVSYQAASSDHPKDYVLHPLGLIMRGAITYLVASARDYADARLYALHRFSRVEILAAAAKTPEGFNLDTAITNGLADFAIQGEPIQLELRCTEDVAAFIAETPLAADQMVTPDVDGWVRLTATVNDTRQLHWWLLGQGNAIVVLGPASLRTAAIESVTQSMAQYEAPKVTNAKCRLAKSQLLEIRGNK